MNPRTSMLATAAAALFLAGTALPALAADEAAPAKIKCEGVNSCKGHSDCKTLLSSCAGQNSCKGKGFRMLTPDECDAAKASMMKSEKK